MGFPLTPSQWTRTGVTLGAGLAGALINLKPFPILHGVDVVFGSILALAPAILYGPFHGGIAAALSFLPGLTQGHHTFALVLGIGQAMALGWRLRRNREAVVETDLLYWFLVGLPLILAFCLFVSGYSLALTITILGIQIVLGVGTAVSCSLWLRVSGVEGRLNPRVSLHWPMKTYLAHTVALMMLTPIAVGIVGFGEWYRSFTWHQLNMDTVSFGRSSLARAEMLTDRYMEEIASLAYAASDSMTSLAKLDRRISLTRASNDDFLSVAIVDAEGQIVASSPLADADEDNVPDWRTEDPTLLRQARQAEGVFLTALARCSITGRISTLTVAPIRDAEGRFLGYARAAVSLDRIAENMLAEPTAHHSFMAVLDEQGRAIVSNIPFLKQTQSLDVAVLGRLEPGEDGAFLIVPTPESPLDGEAVLWRQHDPRSGWETVIIHPLDDHLESLHTAYATLMAGAVLMLCAMVVINRRWTGKVTASLENLAVLVDTSPDQLGHEDWRFNSGVTEVNTLADALGRDVAQRRRTEAALAGHNAILSMVAHGAALPGVLRAVAHQVETEIPGARCAVFLLEQDAQRLRPFASPSLPEAYARSLDGALLAEAPAFVRVACRLGRPRSSETLSGNSQWPIHRQLAEEHGFMACCAVPMQGSGNMLLGLILIYRASHIPGGDLEREAMDGAAQLAGVAIERARAAEQLAHNAFHDPVTGLHNRMALANFAAELGPKPVTLFLVDLDNFKLVNDSLGHNVGDQLLIQMARRMAQCVGPDDMLARHGGDEFTLLHHACSIDAAASLAERLLQCVDEPFMLAEREVFITCSIGIALQEGPPLPLAELVRRADLAMYRVKQDGKSSYAIFDRSMSVSANERLQLAAELRLAPERGELRLHYQPLISLRRRAVSGFEALVRWQHPTRGLLGPGEFIALAEETGLILPIGRWILREACRQAREWQDRFPDTAPRVNVNLSGRQFTRGNLVEEVASALSETGLRPVLLRLEITESILMENVERTIDTMQRLKALGVSMAIDDFGSGFSSLSSLQRFPFDDLKIDRSFIQEMGEDMRTTALVSSVLRLAQSLNLTVTAEGVETREQAETLEEMGCQTGQGYHFARPLPPEQAEAYLR